MTYLKLVAIQNALLLVITSHICQILNSIYISIFESSNVLTFNKQNHREVTYMMWVEYVLRNLS